MSVSVVVLLLGLVALALSASGTIRREQHRTAVRLAAVERKLDAMLAHVGAVVPEATYPAVEELVRRQRVVEAVRAYREETGADLLTAKQAVDAIAARLGR
ncbi:hypothetical protein EDD30_5921 [Couchioplanes caeruleus]|uniref:Ribosomal protein L7/L12 C-terminal domain-containing protein n=3 Tax=Couchioplanes caeruleus TaxID=56438 RepID=A0A1K0GQJ8_9ACTN|nr:hypothetical protein BG844_15195 [Couchioplanes caeruleus subsp. caeruleus]ROP32963.1 hypothetical protein EDD30_5921 [Couchioplanes caeruleus]